MMQDFHPLAEPAATLTPWNMWGHSRCSRSAFSAGMQCRGRGGCCCHDLGAWHQWGYRGCMRLPDRPVVWLGRVTEARVQAGMPLITQLWFELMQQCIQGREHGCGTLVCMCWGAGDCLCEVRLRAWLSGFCARVQGFSFLTECNRTNLLSVTQRPAKCLAKTQTHGQKCWQALIASSP